MQTNIISELLKTPKGQTADAILRSCVHCGFCSATCPTYQIKGDELDSPRGRIYQIKRVLEGGQATAATQLHLDRCLTCLNCETTCPSGVQYNRLLDIGREVVEQQVKRSWSQRVVRALLLKLLPYPKRIRPLLFMGRLFRPLLPKALKVKIPARQTLISVQSQTQARKVLLFSGCVQQVMTPVTNQQLTKLLNAIGIETIAVAGETCCGAVSHHFSEHESAKQFVKKNIDAWWPYVEQGVEAIVISASGCGKVIQDYPDIIADEPEYFAKAQQLVKLCKDPCELFDEKSIATLKRKDAQKIAFHAPCTLQHGLKLAGRVERLLTAAGFDLVPIEESHMCCGSAGTYSITQATMSQQLLTRKLTHLQHHQPELIATANIGCQLHLGTKANVAVVHWLELFE